MLRLSVSILLMSFATLASGSEPKGRFDGIWLFDGAPSYPGVTMMEVATRGGRTTGTVTTTWYGPIDMQNVKGIQGHSVYKDGTAEIWSKPLTDGSVAVALFNRGDVGIQMQLQPADAGFAALTSIYDLWQGAAVKVDATMFKVPAHGVTLLKIRGRS